MTEGVPAKLRNKFGRTLQTPLHPALSTTQSHHHHPAAALFSLLPSPFVFFISSPSSTSASLSSLLYFARSRHSSKHAHRAQKPNIRPNKLYIQTRLLNNNSVEGILWFIITIDRRRVHTLRVQLNSDIWANDRLEMRRWRLRLQLWYWRFLCRRWDVMMMMMMAGEVKVAAEAAVVEQIDVWRMTIYANKEERKQDVALS